MTQHPATNNNPTSTTSTVSTVGATTAVGAEARGPRALRARCVGTPRSRWHPAGQADLAPSGARARVAANLAALATLAELEASGQTPDDAARRVLARWSGWGAVPAVFDGTDPRFAVERDALRELVGPAGMAAAATSTLNAHYTDLGIVAAVWETVAALGFTGGTVLEPGCGSGNFLHHAPPGAQVIAVEQEPTTARIAAALHPEATVRCESFADTTVAALPGGAPVDLVVGNVPFGKVALHDRRYNRANRVIHNHFVIKSLCLTRPGGLVVVLTSRFTLDARDPAARREIAALGDLLGAVRLPSGAHERAAGTAAVTDLLVLRRHDHDDPRTEAEREAERGAGGAGFEATMPVPGHDDPKVRVNRYWAEHPGRVLGTFAVRHGAYSARSLRVDPRPGELGEQLHDALAGIVADARTAGLTLIPTAPATRPARAGGEVGGGVSVVAGPARPVALDAREGLLAVDPDGGFTRIEAGRPVRHEVPRSQARELAALLGLRDTVVALLDLEARERVETPRMRELRAELGARHDGYLARFGPITRATVRRTGRVDPATGEPRTARTTPRQGGFRTDPYAPAVYALEHPDPTTGPDEQHGARPVVRADIFRGRVIAPRAPRRSADSPGDALAICLDAHARVDLAVIAGLLGTGEADARARLGCLVFHDPQRGRLVPAAEYLSGDVRVKLAAAQDAAAQDPALAPNVAALRAVVPTDLGPGEITAHLGAAWIDARHIEAFMREVLDDPSARVEHPGGAVWEVRGARYGVAATQTWGTTRRPAAELVAAACEQRPVRVTDTVEGRDGVKRQVLNLTETLAAQDKAKQLGERFAEWVWEDPARAGELCRVYNQAFNAVVLRSYDAAGPDTLSLPGLAQGFTPRPHQYAAVARMIAEPAVGLFHEVGAGKTAEMAMGAMELRRLGLVRKPAIVVPNNMLEQWAREFTALYPAARLLVATHDDLTRDRRRAFVARVATGDWDAVIMTRSAFERLPMSREAQERYLGEETDRITRWLERAKGAGAASLSVKRVQRMLLAATERIKGKLDSVRDDGVSFEQTGIDYLCIDEAHLYKNLRTPSNITGAAIEGSARAQDLDMKLGYLRSRAGARVVTLATATPIANSITETYVMQRYTRPDLLEAAGVEEFDQWAATFGEVVTTVEMTPDAAGFRLTDRFARFTGVPELLRLWHVSADIKTGEDLQLPVPQLTERPEDGARAAHTVLIEASPELREFVGTLGARAEAIRNKQVEPHVDNMLRICSEGRAAALDLRLLDRPQTGPATVERAAENIAAVWAAHRDDRFTRPDGTTHPTPGALQIVFCDLGTPGPGWNVYDELREQLAARGLPRRGVRFIHDATTDTAKGALFAAARSGEVAVLIGSTEKMGVGTNVQARAVALHHLDCPWRPADLHQRDGRILRQGNPYPEVTIYRYVTEGSFDGYSWQTVARKARFIGQVMRGRLDVREIADVGEATLSFDEVKALASGDPRIIEKARLDAEVATLDRLERAHWRNQARLEHTITTAETAIDRGETDLAGLDTAIAARRPTRGQGFTASIGDRDYRERSEFATDLAALLAAALDDPARRRTGWGECAVLGGLTLTHSIARELRAGQLVAEHHLQFTAAPGDPVRARADELDARAGGTLATLEHRHAALDTRRARAAAALETTRRELALARDQLGAPFTRADELTDKRRRADELAQAMTELARDTEAAAAHAAAETAADTAGAETAGAGDEPAGGEEAQRAA
ncbi:SNF2-related protein [Actinomycetospora termitidis]|uniref:SNF2-related protein n=1 Tax=Actinomycetospora termitidis TaxID=3053470 RepID=A0ABT7MIB2_9PSEU|nr:SNF2-related protein [Actinomycetospora sp. Odt1-22]MDL5160417.1 SNF2-related protein [Actinomycetospora sp. Odt1-22]